MKPISLFIFGLFLPFFVYSQAQLSGQLNNYAKVTAYDPCLNSITVDNISSFQVGDRVLLIQMQGATISASDNADFGTITDLGSAGLYEKGTIDAIAGDDVYLVNTLLQTYDVSGSLQLLSVPRYTDAQVVGRIEGKPWDGQTGGIIAFEVDNQLEFLPAGFIDAVAIGFRGGLAKTNLPNDCSWLNQQRDYFYSGNSWKGSAKGEGIAPYINGKEAGKGPQANGGGGGNDHNSGGGGGGHVRSGGEGGKNEEPSTFGCKGNHPGLGGREIINGAGARVFMGGGGGAGHGNNDLSSDGAAGGGIVMISTTDLRVAAAADAGVFVNGDSPDLTAGDGAGGGGAGGSFLLEAQNLQIMGTFDIQAIGGEGGMINNQGANRCHGPGGGGSGGLVAINSASTIPPNMSILIHGGTAGISTNSGACSDSANGGQGGGAGNQESFAGFPESTVPGEVLSINLQPVSQQVCDGDAISFTINATGLDVDYQWQIDLGSGFQNIIDGGIYAGASSANLTINPADLTLDGVVFRCQISNDCFGNISSQAATLNILSKPSANFTYALNGATATFNNLSTAANDYLWDFGDGQMSSLTAPSHTFPVDGIYTVTLTASNSCGDSVFSIEIAINTVVAPEAVFTADLTLGCAPLNVQFTDQSANGVTDWLWSFPGGNPSSSTDQNPVVTYAAAGVYDVGLRVSNSAGMDEVQSIGFLKVMALPMAAFSVSTNNNTAQFNNLSTDSNSYLWDFGDGQTSSQMSPNHTYAADGNYTVSLTVMNDCGTDTFILMVTIESQLPPIASFTLSQGFGCTPMTVQYSDLSTNEATSWFWSFPGGNPATSSEQNPVVLYEMAGVFDVGLKVTNAVGESELFLEDVVAVEDSPQADFTFTQVDFTFNFTNNSQDALSYFWDFGDGSPFSSETNPVHTYTAEGTYSVSLTASNNFCATILTIPVSIYLSATEDPSENALWEIWPNPNDGQFWIKTAEELQKGRLILSSLNGQVLQEFNWSNTAEQLLELNPIPSGIYLLQLQLADRVLVKKLVVY